ncbi:hypothetical protein Rt10032_c05g2368 [Rhodotorula toruloides]|uniref:Uncharacterized protein n=1 Tax=Rhodotorula toruloides TaxID=5286 RepID=A0A511KDA7_RHOTO|nr:hypothetical protein Rt10032_c05g2368 [Rhodotorula toruloides]
MWCDNCLLVFPLRAGAMALATLIAVYSIAGGIILFMYGQFLWFTYPEAQVYGGISMAVGACSILLLLAWTSALQFLLPFLLFVSAVRAGIMIFRLDYYQSNVTWECNHGGTLWNVTIANSTNIPTNTSDRTLPSSFCSSGFHSLYLAFAFALCIDVALQLYQYFLVWRFKAFLTQYYTYKQPTGGFVAV